MNKDISRMKNIVDISYMITHSMNFFDIKDEIVDKMLESVHPAKACINLFYDDDYDNAYLTCSRTLKEIPNKFKTITENGIKIKFDNYPDYIHESIKEEKIIYIENVFKDERAYKERELARIEGYVGRIVFPLVVNYNVVGFMTCFISHEEKIEEDDIDFISSIASLISLSIDVTTRNYASKNLIDKLRGALVSINDATRKLHQNRDINEFLNHISGQACNITRSNEAIITIEASKNMKKILSLHRIDKKNKSDIFPLLPQIKSNSQTGSFINKRLNYKENFIENYIYYRLQDGDETFGYIVCANGGMYTKDDLNILSILAKQIHIAIKLFEYSVVEVNHKVLANELKILNTQQKLLMDEKKINNEYGKNLNFYHRPSKVVGGDFYYSVKVDDNRTAFIVSDVMGHGIVSNYVVALMKGAFKVLSKVYSTSGEIMTKLNEMLFDEFDKMEIFATGIICMMDTKNEILEISNAGHYYPAILNDNREIVRDISFKKGMPIGVLDNSTYLTDRISLTNISSIWMYTDGIIEVKNSQKQEFGIDRLEKILKNSLNKDYDIIVKELEDELKEFSNKENYEDDILLVMLNDSNV